MVGVRISDTNVYKNIRDFKDVLAITIMIDQKYTFLPEIYEVFGKEKMLKFMSIFGGTTVQVPTEDDLVQTIRDVQLYIDVVNRKNGRPPFSQIADKYEMTKPFALQVFNRIRKKVEGFEGVELDEVFTPKGNDVIDDD